MRSVNQRSISVIEPGVTSLDHPQPDRRQRRASAVIERLHDPHRRRPPRPRSIPKPVEARLEGWPFAPSRFSPPTPGTPARPRRAQRRPRASTRSGNGNAGACDEFGRHEPPAVVVRHDTEHCVACRHQPGARGTRSSYAAKKKITAHALEAPTQVARPPMPTAIYPASQDPQRNT